MNTKYAGLLGAVLISCASHPKNIAPIVAPAPSLVGLGRQLQDVRSSLDDAQAQTRELEKKLAELEGYKK